METGARVVCWSWAPLQLGGWPQDVMFGFVPRWLSTGLCFVLVCVCVARVAILLSGTIFNHGSAPCLMFRAFFAEAFFVSSTCIPRCIQIIRATCNRHASPVVENALLAAAAQQEGPTPAPLLPLSRTSKPAFSLN